MSWRFLFQPHCSYFLWYQLEALAGDKDSRNWIRECATDLCLFYWVLVQQTQEISRSIHSWLCSHDPLKKISTEVLQKNSCSGDGVHQWRYRLRIKVADVLFTQPCSLIHLRDDLELVDGFISTPPSSLEFSGSFKIRSVISGAQQSTV